MADEDQSSLITALKERDHSTWNSAVDRHLHEVYGFVFHLVKGDRTVAQDLNQEIWLEAMDGIDQCDATQGSFRNWLFGIARKRVALHYRRRALGGNLTSLSDQFGEATAVGDASVLPQDVLEQVKRVSVVRAAMLLLPDDRRKALLWKYVEGLSVETIAIRLGRTAETLRKTILDRVGRAEMVAHVTEGVTNPLIGPLANNGGPTLTHALLPGSPALDAGSFLVATDQRGFGTPVDLLVAARLLSRQQLWATTDIVIGSDQFGRTNTFSSERFLVT